MARAVLIGALLLAGAWLLLSAFQAGGPAGCRAPVLQVLSERSEACEDGAGVRVGQAVTAAGLALAVKVGHPWLRRYRWTGPWR